MHRRPTTRPGRRHRKAVRAATAGALLLAANAVHGVALVNGDFDAGFGGWQGVLVDADGARVVDPALHANHFTELVDGDGDRSAFLHFDFGVPVHGVELFQDFSPSVSLVGLALGFDWLWRPSNPLVDRLVARLELAADASVGVNLFALAGPGLDPAAGVRNRLHAPLVDLAPPGTPLRVRFGLADADGDIRDQFVVDAVRIAPLAVDAPSGTALLLPLALALVRTATRRRGSS